jgi:hypothetical protein
VHGPAGAREYRYLPTFILRGLARLNLEFTLAGDTLPGDQHRDTDRGQG